MSLQQVTEEQFYGIIYSQGFNVHPTPEGKWPYTSIFNFPSGKEFGRHMEELTDGHHPVKSTYFIEVST